MIKLLFNKNGEVVPELNIKNIRMFVEILEETSQHEEVRKTVSELKNFDEYFMIALENASLDITQDLSKKDFDTSAIIMHFYTFICNICYTSINIRDKISAKIEKIMERINKFIANFDFSSSTCTNVIECVISLIINLSCGKDFRQKLKKYENFINFLITDVISKISTTDNFEKYDELYEKSLSLLYNLTIQDDLNLHYIKLNLSKILIRYFNTNFKSFEDRIKERNTSLSVLRTISMINKLVKTDLIDFIQNSQFLKNVFDFLNLRIRNKNSEVLDETLK